jgi:hypothetical protein
MRFGFFSLFLLFNAFFDLSPAKADPVPFACTLRPDGHTVSVTIKNPFDRETSCQVNCQFSTQRAGTSFQISCTRTVQPGTEAEICKKVYDKEPLVKMTGGDGDCIKQIPLDENKAEPEDDNDALIKRMMKDSEDTIDRQPEK